MKGAHLKAVTNTTTEITFQAASMDIWDKKYRLKAKDGSIIDSTIDATYQRVARAIAEVETTAEKRQEWYDKFLWALRHGAIPAGRIISNAGALAHKPATSTINCTVSGTIGDSMDDILGKVHEAGLTLKAGCGIGYEFSTLRPKGAYVSGAGAYTSGPLSFMDIYDKMCFTVSSAGGRRGAQSPVHLQPPRPRRLLARLQLRRTPLSSPEIDLVRRLPGECGMRNRRVVLGNVELDVPANRCGRLESMQEQPLVLQLAPPALNHRVREPYVHERANTAQKSVPDKRVNLAVEVLHATVGHYRRPIIAAHRVAHCFLQNGDGVGDLETLGNAPSENPTTEVVDDRVEPDLSSIDQTNSGGIDMPDLIRRLGSHANCRTRWMLPIPRSSPLVVAHEPVPSRRRREYLTHALSQNGESPGRHMSIPIRRHHRLDDTHLVRRESRRCGTRARRIIRQFTASVCSDPCVVTRRRDPDNLEHRARG